MFLSGHGLGSWQKLEVELALNRNAREGDGFPVIPVLLPGFDPADVPLQLLELFTWVDLRDFSKHEFDLLAAAVTGTAVHDLGRVRSDLEMKINPYRGLRVFREEDRSFFFGREKITDDIVQLVRAHPFVGVLGASGSGKSSIARAGVLPVLRRGDDEGAWAILTMEPGADPALNLAEKLAPALEPQLTAAARDTEIAAIRARLTAQADARKRGNALKLKSELVATTGNCGSHSPLRHSLQSRRASSGELRIGKTSSLNSWSRI